MSWPDIGLYSVEWLGETLVATSVLILLVLFLRKAAIRLFGPQLAYWLWAIPFLRLVMPPIVGEQQSITTLSAALIAPETFLPEWMFIFWAGGAVIISAITMSCHYAFRSRIFAGHCTEPSFQGFRVVRSPAAEGPMAIGLFRPTIVIPENFDENFSAEEREQVLRHEVEHLKHGDLWANLAAIAFLAVHWFNPLSWMAWRVFRLDQEGACDARSTKSADRTERAIYATALAKAAYGPNMFPARLVAPMVTKCELKQRLWLLRRSRSHTGMHKACGLVSLFGLATTTLLATATVVHAEPGALYFEGQASTPGYPVESTYTPKSHPVFASSVPVTQPSFVTTARIDAELSRIQATRRHADGELCPERKGRRDSA